MGKSKEKSGFWASLWGKEEKGVKRDKLVRDYKLKVANARERMARNDYELKRLQKEIESAIQQGRKAAAEGNAMGMSRAAMDLKTKRGLQSQLLGTMNLLQKSTYVIEQTVAQLELASDSSMMEILHSAQQIMDDPEINELLLNSTLDCEAFKQKIDMQFSMMMTKLGVDTDRDLGDLEDEMKLFEQLNVAVKRGDEKKATEIQAKLTGTSPAKIDSESVLGDVFSS